MMQLKVVTILFSIVTRTGRTCTCILALHWMCTRAAVLILCLLLFIVGLVSAQCVRVCGVCCVVTMMSFVFDKYNLDVNIKCCKMALWTFRNYKITLNTSTQFLLPIILKIIKKKFLLKLFSPINLQNITKFNIIMCEACSINH